MSDLKPCPFCKAALVWSDAYSEYHHPVAKCILSGHKFKKGMIGQWNRRALPAVQSDDDKLVRHMTKLIATGLDRIEQLTSERDRLREAIDYILDGMGIADPDYDIDPDDDFLDAANSEWVRDTITRLAAALKGETP